jgi:hypothetical protein
VPDLREQSRDERGLRNLTTTCRNLELSLFSWAASCYHRTHHDLRGDVWCVIAGPGPHPAQLRFWEVHATDSGTACKSHQRLAPHPSETHPPTQGFPGTDP